MFVFAGTFMGSMMTSSECLKRTGRPQRHVTSSWGIMLTGTTVLFIQISSQYGYMLLFGGIDSFLASVLGLI